MSGLNYWWQRHQKIKEKLKDYMKEHNLDTVEQAVDHLLDFEFNENWLEEQ